MSSPHPMGQNFPSWQPAGQQQQMPQGSPVYSDSQGTQNDFTVRPMRVKVLYTFDDQKTNCLARAQDVLQIKTITIEDGTLIGIVDLKTCIEAVIQCSPELNNRLGGDFTVYAYDYSEYDNPLVGQGMLSKALAAASPYAPAQQSEKLITGRVCNNIMGIFSNGVKETLEVKLRLVPVPTSMQNEYVSTMEKYRDNSTPVGFDQAEWNRFMQSTPDMMQLDQSFGQIGQNAGQSMGQNVAQNMGQNTGQLSQNIGQVGQGQPGSRYASPMSANGSQQRGNMEVVNQLLSPVVSNPETVQPQPPPQHHQQAPFTPPLTVDSSTEGTAATGPEATTIDNPKTTSRPASKAAAAKRPYRKRAPKTTPAVGGNTSGYEEGTDGDDGPAPRKRAKITQADYPSRPTFGWKSATESLRVTASTAGSLRQFRPLGPTIPGSHLEEIPRPPTPLPNQMTRPNVQSQDAIQSHLRRSSFTSQNSVFESQIDAPRRHISPYPPLGPQIAPEDEVRKSIESANPSPERTYSPVDTPDEIGSSPPVMRMASVAMRSSPPCPSSPVLPQMPRADRHDSGFMSGSIEELFGEEEVVTRPVLIEEDVVEIPAVIPKPVVKPKAKRKPSQLITQSSSFGELDNIGSTGFIFEEETPGPMDVLPTKMATFVPAKHAQKSAQDPNFPRRRTGSIMSEDGQILPPLSYTAQAISRQNTPSRPHDFVPPVPLQLPQDLNFSQGPTQRQGSLPAQDFPRVGTQILETQASSPAATSQLQPHPGSRTLARTASVGTLKFPTILASDSNLPPSSLHRSQTWSEGPRSATDAPTSMMFPPPGMQYAEPGADPATLRHFDQNGQEIVMNRFAPSHAKCKVSIKEKLRLAVEKGEMPTFCANCGAVETPTWRKAYSQDHQGVPSYHEYSEERGRVTAIVILTRDEENKPTSYQIVKKLLGRDEAKEDYKEFTMCNPCGIWLSKNKCHRPQEIWKSNKPPATRPGASKKSAKGGKRSKKAGNDDGMEPTSEAGIPQSEVNFPQSEANFPQSDGPIDITSPDATKTTTAAVVRVPVKFRPMKRMSTMTSDAASAALRKALKSSPSRWNGPANSPVEVEGEELGETRRLLFPSPRKDGSPKVLGDVVVTNVVQVATEFRSPKEAAVEAPNKENCPPIGDDEGLDLELEALFEEEEELARPTTPVQNAPAPNPFKTPTRKTPNHRPLTRSVSRSVSKSLRSAKSPGPFLMLAERTPSRTPTSVMRRREPRLSPHLPSSYVSPFTASLNQLMSEDRHGSPTRRAHGIQLDFGNLPDLPICNSLHGAHQDNDFNIEDFLSTDIVMPSSPPRLGGHFNLYEDPSTMTNIDWSQFAKTSKSPGEEEVVIKTEEADEQLDDVDMVGAKRNA